MKYLIVDIGSHTVKFVHANVEKKTSTLLGASEINIQQFQEEHEQQNEDAVFEIIKSHIEKNLNFNKILLSIPSSFISMRFLSLPIKNKKKANLMIPFQLEEELPFSQDEIHSANILNPTPNGFEAIVTFFSKEKFRPYFEKLQGVVPDILTVEASAYMSFIKRQQINHPICILDIGHQTTKAYFFNHGNLCSYHVSYIAGSAITEMISVHYKISRDEASIYKHQNAFLLTKEQYNQVNDAQKEFANLMEKLFSPLLSEIKRWEISFRVKTGIRINQILLTGGTSNIKNLNNYLTEQIGVRTRHLNLADGVVVPENLSDKRLQSRLALAALLSLIPGNKMTLLNLRSGVYTSHNSDALPLYSLSFVTTRVIILFMVILAGVFTERLILNKRIDDLNKKVATVIKDDVLEIRARDKRQFRRKPDERLIQTVLSTVRKKKKAIEAESLTIKQAGQVNAVAPLLQLSKFLKGSDKVYLQDFQSDNAFHHASFKLSKDADINDFKEQLESLGLDNAKVEVIKQDLMIKISFGG